MYTPPRKVSNFSHPNIKKTQLSSNTYNADPPYVCIPELKNKSYEIRLKELYIFSLENRRLSEDMTEILKILKDLDWCDQDSLF